MKTKQKCYLLLNSDGKMELKGTLQFSIRNINGMKNVNQTISLTKYFCNSMTNIIFGHREL